ncbi:hypothetical protein C2E23DRAFT_886785 [Lenzites betulinus]|nr:hypothetical protein C2E23DRAFT_886785 [Lenzites betulinus]
MKLLRCSRCYSATYCSKECQKAHWQAGHKQSCNVYNLMRERATAISGNDKAWFDLTTFLEFHHTTLLNCVLASYLRMKPMHGDRGPADHFIQFSMLYRNDPTLPAHMKFEPRGMDLVHKDEAALPGQDGFAFCWRERDSAVKMGKRELGSKYAATGAYFVAVKFSDGPAVGFIPFWKHFGIDDRRWNALPSVRHPWDIFKETIEGGKKVKFCCGSLPELGTCCCGGWTHTPEGHAP